MLDNFSVDSVSVRNTIAHCLLLLPWFAEELRSPPSKMEMSPASKKSQAKSDKSNRKQKKEPIVGEETLSYSKPDFDFEVSILIHFAEIWNFVNICCIGFFYGGFYLEVIVSLNTVYKLLVKNIEKNKRKVIGNRFYTRLTGWRWNWNSRSGFKAKTNNASMVHSPGSPLRFNS